MDFKQLKQQSSLGSLTEKLLKEAEKMGSGSSSERNPNLFVIDRDKSGIGMAIIRFLYSPPGEEDPFVRLLNHGFKVNGKWLIENCPTTIGKECPVCASNSVLWNSGIDTDKKIASQRKRKLSFYSNVYIVKNPADPSLEGKVMLFRYGQKIFDKIISAMKPDFEGDDPVEVFDMWKGANFKIKVKTIRESNNSYPNYDDSSFMNPSPLSDDDEEIERIWKQCHSLQELISPDKFKSQEDLQKRLESVLGNRSLAQVREQEKDLENSFSCEPNLMKELEEKFTHSKSSEDDDLEDEYDSSLEKFRELAS
jgi:hypothetical protein